MVDPRARQAPGVLHDLDNPNRPPLDLRRVQRALALSASRLGSGTYAVQGPSGTYHVSLRPHLTCDCGDHIWKDSISKHIISALLAHGDAQALQAATALEALREERRAGTSARGDADILPGRS